MNKKTFLDRLRGYLSSIPEADAAGSVAYYAEMIDDRMEEGLSEEEAVAAVGDPAQIAGSILSEMSFAPAEQPAVSRRRLRGWEILLLILGFPVWFPLLVAAAAVAFSLWVTLWSVVISLYATAFALGVSAIGCVLAGFFMVSGSGAGFVAWGAALICAGLAILFFLLSNLAAKGVIVLTRLAGTGIKKSFAGKEHAK